MIPESNRLGEDGEGFAIMMQTVLPGFNLMNAAFSVGLMEGSVTRTATFGLAHLRRHLDLDVSLRSRLAAAVERRHDALRYTAGLNEEVFDALILLAAGS